MTEQLSTDLDFYLEQYSEFVRSFDPEVNVYSEFEVSKIAIADSLLKILGIPTGPPEPGAKPNQPNESDFRSGYVYLMKNCRNGYIKIGFSKNPQFREKTLQSEEPEINLIAKWKSTTATELALHRKFKLKHLRGEWFNLSNEDVAVISSLFQS